MLAAARWRHTYNIRLNVLTTTDTCKDIATVHFSQARFIADPMASKGKDGICGPTTHCQTRIAKDSDNILQKAISCMTLRPIAKQFSTICRNTGPTKGRRHVQYSALGS